MFRVKWLANVPPPFFSFLVLFFFDLKLIFDEGIYEYNFPQTFHFQLAVSVDEIK